MTGNGKSMIRLILISLLFFIPEQINAQGENTFPPSYYDLVAVILLLLIMISFITLIYFEVRKPANLNLRGLFGRLWTFINRSTPVENEKDILLDHNYDGIRELDSRVPPWFSWLFYITIIFAIYYLLDYHVFNTGKLMYDEYAEEMQKAEIKKAELMKSGALINEETVTELTDKPDLDKGKEIFSLNCIACHASDGGGIVGPNLTDDYWINGGGIKNIFKTIKYGVPSKGMISWQTQLNPTQIQEVASYVMSLHGTKPANPKAPEGELWKETDSDADK